MCQPVVCQTAYQISNEDGTSDRFIIQSFPVNKLVKTYSYECAPGTWIPIKEVCGKVIAHKRPVEDTQMLFHLRTRKCLAKIYGSRLSFDSLQSTIFNEQ